MLLQNYSLIKTPAYMQIALDEITRKNRLEFIFPAIFLIVVYTLLTVISMFFMRKLFIGASRKIEYALRKKLYNKLLSLDMAFFQKNETGDLVSRCTNDLNEVRQLLGPGIMFVPNALTRFCLFIPILLSLSPPLLSIIMILMFALIVFIVIVLPRLRPLFRKIQESVGIINSRVWQIISGISTIKLYTLEEIEIGRFKQLNDEYIRRHMTVVRYRSLIWPFLIFIFSTTELVILLVGGRQVIQQEMTIGQLLQFNIMIAHLAFPIFSLGWVMSLIQQGISAMGRINYILDYPVEKYDNCKTLDTDELVFTVKNLSYQYPEHREKIPGKIPSIPPLKKGGTATDALEKGKNEKVLERINLTIETGQVVGITGTIGSGKSTLVNLMTGLFKPEPGMLFVNGFDLRDIKPESLFNKISMVPQEPFLFSRSITENIALGTDGDINMKEIKEAVRRAGLERDIETFPKKYDQIVGERGITLSGGQKQRTAIARALRKQSPVLILDDALSSVDSQTESEILDNLKSLDSFKTVIIISHRISALKNADRIYVLDKGEIVEQGTHAELLQNDKLYARLAKIQQLEMEFAADTRE